MGALIGAGCLAAGLLIPIAVRSMKSGIDQRPHAEARSLAMRTVLALDDFVGASYAAVHDTPEFNPMDEGEFVFHVPEPVLVLPKDAKWEIFGTELSDEILWLSNRVSNLTYALDSLDLASPGLDDFFERRRDGYAGLAAEALDLIDRMLKEFDLTLPAKPDYYRQREGLLSAIKGAGERSSIRRKNSAVAQSNGSNVLELFPRASEEAD